MILMVRSIHLPELTSYETIIFTRGQRRSDRRGGTVLNVGLELLSLSLYHHSVLSFPAITRFSLSLPSLGSLSLPLLSSLSLPLLSSLSLPSLGSLSLPLLSSLSLPLLSSLSLPLLSSLSLPLLSSLSLPLLSSLSLPLLSSLSLPLLSSLSLPSLSYLSLPSHVLSLSANQGSSQSVKEGCKNPILWQILFDVV